MTLLTCFVVTALAYALVIVSSIVSELILNRRFDTHERP